MYHHNEERGIISAYELLTKNGKSPGVVAWVSRKDSSEGPGKTANQHPTAAVGDAEILATPAAAQACQPAQNTTTASEIASETASEIASETKRDLPKNMDTILYGTVRYGMVRYDTIRG